MVLLAEVGGAQHAQPFSISSHDAVLDTVVDHLDKVAGAVCATVQITLLRCAASFFAP
jgi:hypothetical protein